MKIIAPWPQIKTTLVLPNPRFEDSVKPTNTVQTHVTMLGDVRTYVKSNDAVGLRLVVDVADEKAIEVGRFLSTYRGYDLQIQTPGGTYVGKFTGNLSSISQTRIKAGVEQRFLTLNFEAIKQ